MRPKCEIRQPKKAINQRVQTRLTSSYLRFLVAGSPSFPLVDFFSVSAITACRSWPKRRKTLTLNTDRFNNRNSLRQITIKLLSRIVERLSIAIKSDFCHSFANFGSHFNRIYV